MGEEMLRIIAILSPIILQADYHIFMVSEGLVSLIMMWDRNIPTPPPKVINGMTNSIPVQWTTPYLWTS